MNSPPCRTCDKRSAVCHAICEDYKNWKIKKDIELKIRKQDLEDQDTVIQGMIRKHKYKPNQR